MDHSACAPPKGINSMPAMPLDSPEKKMNIYALLLEILSYDHRQFNKIALLMKTDYFCVSRVSVWAWESVYYNSNQSTLFHYS